MKEKVRRFKLLYSQHVMQTSIRAISIGRLWPRMNVVRVSNDKLGPSNKLESQCDVIVFLVTKRNGKEWSTYISSVAREVGLDWESLKGRRWRISIVTIMYKRYSLWL